MKEQNGPKGGFGTQGRLLGEVETLFELKVCEDQWGKDIEHIFRDHPDVPGVIVEDEDSKLIGSVSRLRFMSLLSTAFGRELFLKRRLRHIRKKNEGLLGTMILESDLPIDKAIKLALERPSAQKYDPFVVKDKKTGEARLLNMFSLLNQHLEQTQHLNELLISANTEKDEMLAIASHDLKNPLGVISSMAELLMSGELNEDTKTDFYAGIHANSYRMLEIITSFIDASRLEQDLEEAKFKWIKALPLIESRFNSHLDSANRKNQNLHLTQDYDAELEIYTDPDRWSSVIDNLLSNAIKYTPKGGMISVMAFNSKRNFNLSIRDNGPGISKDDQKKMFGKFVRLSAKPTGEEGSTGLGLYSVKKILGTLGGDISLESSLGKGSNFKVKIPLREKDKDAHED